MADEPVVIDLSGGVEPSKEESKEPGFMSKKTEDLLKQSDKLEKELEELEAAHTKESEVAAEEKEIAELIEADPDEKSFKKRYGDLRTHLNTKQSEFEEKAADFRDKITALEKDLSAATSTQMQMPTSEEEFKAWAEEFPQAAKMMETIALQKVNDIEDKYNDRFKKLEEEEAKLTRKQTEAELTSLHADWQELRATSEFHDWADGQPEAIKDILYSPKSSARAVATVVSSYKMEVLNQKGQPKQDLAADAEMVRSMPSPTEPRPKNTKVWKESAVEAMPVAEYEVHMTEIDKAMADGSFVYDISGG